MEENETFCEGELQEQLVEDAAHDAGEIGSETVDDEIRSESDSELLQGLASSEVLSFNNPTVDDGELLHGLASSENFNMEGEYTGRGYNLRSRNTRDFSHRASHATDDPTNNQSYDIQMLQDSIIDMQEGGDTQPLFKHLVGIIMTQMSAKVGIKNMGKKL